MRVQSRVKSIIPFDDPQDIYTYIVVNESSLQKLIDSIELLLASQYQKRQKHGSPEVWRIESPQYYW